MTSVKDLETSLMTYFYISCYGYYDLILGSCDVSLSFNDLGQIPKSKANELYSLTYEELCLECFLHLKRYCDKAKRE